MEDLEVQLALSWRNGGVVLMQCMKGDGSRKREREKERKREREKERKRVRKRESGRESQRESERATKTNQPQVLTIH